MATVERWLDGAEVMSVATIERIVREALAGEVGSGVPALVVERLVDEMAVMPSDRWEEECHACSVRIGSHLLDGRCPVDECGCPRTWATVHGDVADLDHPIILHDEDCSAGAPKLEDLLEEGAAWCRDASLGDHGEVPSFELFWDSKGRWAAAASSFYDGGGSGEGAEPTEAVAACLAELRDSPDRERSAVRQAAVHALARHLRSSWAEAEAMLDGLSGPAR